MPIELVKECDVQQGYNFKQDAHSRFGYLNTLTLGENSIAPDIKVATPAAIAPPAPGAGSSAGAGESTAGIFTTPVVAVLSAVHWSTLPTDSITLNGRISVANMQQLSMLTMQSLKRVVVTASFVVYEYDLVAQQYFTSVKSYRGQAPSGVKAPSGGGAGFGADASIAPIHAVLVKTTTEVGIKIGPQAEADPLGIRNHTLEITLAPVIAAAPQQLLIQSSSKVKLVQPWGLPQQ